MLKWIIAPILGGVIGYITNDLAIRMLFRPRKSVYIGKFHIPFTPGLIPSQKGRIAQSIGRVISNQLLNEETLRNTLLSEKTIQSLQEKVKSTVQQYAQDQRTVEVLLESLYGSEQLQTSSQQIEKKLTDLVCQKILEANVGYIITDKLIGGILEPANQNTLFSKLIDSNMKESVRKMLGDKMNNVIKENAPDAIYRIVDKYKEGLMKKQLCDLYAQYQSNEENIIARGTDMYVSILGTNLGKLLKAINVEQIVVDKINAFDAAQLEAMIFGIMKRELKAIVYLGALLGFLMGFINVIF